MRHFCVPHYFLTRRFPAFGVFIVAFSCLALLPRWMMGVKLEGYLFWMRWTDGQLRPFLCCRYNPKANSERTSSLTLQVQYIETIDSNLSSSKVVTAEWDG
jgi:hypothetical protein